MRQHALLRSHRRTALVIAALVLGATACAGSAESDDGPAAPTSTAAVEPSVPPTSAATTEPAAAPLGAELIGRWAHYDVVAYEDGVMRTQIISYGFNDFSVVDGEVIDTASFCFAEQRTDQPIETSISDAATQAIIPPSTPVTVDLVDGVLRIQRDATPTPLGIDLADPTTESLPTDPADPRVTDPDGDGKPGVTVTIRAGDLTGELYIARLEIFAWEGFLVAPDRIEGVVTDLSQQLVLGASDPVFATAGSGWVQHADLTESPIVLVRVDESWGCERLAAESADLFPPVPPIDW
jgi:hypothetical protein